MSSPFDPNAFMNATMTGALDTRRAPLPEADTVGIIGSEQDDVKFRQTSDGTIWLDCLWTVIDDEYKAKADRKTVRVRQSMSVEFDANGQISAGKGINADLGALRQAVGQNSADKPWAPSLLRGAGPARIHIRQRPDKNDPSKIYNEVDRVTAMA